MKKDEKKVIEGHAPDGIQEYDNGVPTLFSILFFGTITFAIAYFFYYSLGNGPTLVQEYERQLTEESIAEAARKANAPATGPTESDLVSWVKDTSRVKQGHALFQTKCAACHGAQGQGSIGPNLTDAYWIHGGKMTDILKVVTNGVADKGMPPWGAMLSNEEIQAATVFIRSLSGSNPAGGKSPQGTLVQ